jgi:cobalamin biosynthesis protein CobD/CbiB
MKKKILNLILLLTSFFGYLEWGESRSMFLFQGELDVLSKLFNDPLSVLHPLILMPIAGQILLFVTLFRKEPGKILTFTGMAGIGVLILVILIVGVLNLEIKTIVSTLPFFITSIFIILSYRKRKLIDQ